MGAISSDVVIRKNKRLWFIIAIISSILIINSYLIQGEPIALIFLALPMVILFHAYSQPNVYFWASAKAITFINRDKKRVVLDWEQVSSIDFGESINSESSGLIIVLKNRNITEIPYYGELGGLDSLHLFFTVESKRKKIVNEVRDLHSQYQRNAKTH